MLGDQLRVGPYGICHVPVRSTAAAEALTLEGFTQVFLDAMLRQAPTRLLNTLSSDVLAGERFGARVRMLNA